MDFALPANICANCQHHLHRNKSGGKRTCNICNGTEGYGRLLNPPFHPGAPRNSTRRRKEAPVPFWWRDVPFLHFWVSVSTCFNYEGGMQRRDVQLENVLPRFTKVFDSIPKLDYSFGCIPCLHASEHASVLLFKSIPELPKTHASKGQHFRSPQIFGPTFTLW